MFRDLHRVDYALQQWRDRREGVPGLRRVADRRRFARSGAGRHHRESRRSAMTAQRVVELCVERRRGGCGHRRHRSNSTVRRRPDAPRQAGGGGCALIVLPYYNRPTPEGQYRHFKGSTTKLISHHHLQRAAAMRVDMTVETCAVASCRTSSASRIDRDWPAARHRHAIKSRSASSRARTRRRSPSW